MNIFQKIRDHCRFYRGQGYPLIFNYRKLYDVDEWGEMTLKGYIADWLFENKIRYRLAGNNIHAREYTIFYLENKDSIIYFLYKDDAVLFKLVVI